MTINRRPTFVDDGRKEWHEDGRLHREDGPAVVLADGTEMWYHKGQLHRVGGAAEIRPKGARAYLQYDLLHRTDGPALSYGSGLNEWWVRGRRFTEEEFNLCVDQLTGEVFVPPGKKLTYDW